MCLGVPMRVVERDGSIARCEAKGIERLSVCFSCSTKISRPGDHVMVHVGYAIQKMSEGEADTAWQLYDEMLAAEEEARVKCMSWRSARAC